MAVARKLFAEDIDSFHNADRRAQANPAVDRCKHAAIFAACAVVSAAVTLTWVNAPEPSPSVPPLARLKVSCMLLCIAGSSAIVAVHEFRKIFS